MIPGDEQVAAACASTRRWWIVSVGPVGFTAWWLGSVLMHAGLFGLLYLASPKEPTPNASSAVDFHMTISPDHVEAVVADIREQQKAEFITKVAELADIKHQLDSLNAAKVEQYNSLMLEEAKQAPQAAQEAATRVRANQKAALQAQAAAQAAIAKVNEAQAKAAGAQNDDEEAAAKSELSAALQTAENAQTAASQSQKIVVAAQAKLGQETNLFGDALNDANRAVQTAADAQQEAEKQQDTAASIRAEVPRLQRQVEEMSKEMQRRRSAVDNAQQRVSVIEKRLAELRPSPTTMPPASAQAVPATSPLLSAAAGGVALTNATVVPPANAPSFPTPAPTPSKKVKEEIDRLTKNLPQATAAEAKSVAQLTESKQKLAVRQAEVVAAFAKLPADEYAAQEKQRAALKAQVNAEQEIAQAMAKPGLAAYSAAPSFSMPPAAPRDANLTQLFNQAQQIEAAVAESYKNVRAAELAAIRRIPLSQAMTLTEVAKPVRAEIDLSVLTRDIRDVQGVREQEKTIEAASAQLNSMVALAQRMKDLAQPTQQAAISVGAMMATAAQSERMEELAAEDEGAKDKDLTAAMTGNEAPTDDGQYAAAINLAVDALATAAVSFAVAPLDVNAMLVYRDALATLAELNPPRALASGDGEGTGRVVWARIFRGVPPLNLHNFKPIPGRTVSHSMVASAPNRDPAWMFVDSWYLIGPWPNPGRKNLNTKFPPESVVDLDATYTGGRQNAVPLPVRWRFYQTPVVYGKKGNEETRGEVVPPGLGEYEIYYGYTELWFDEAADLWVAIGSDDQSKIWLNDQMIWKSADYLKSWAANEGLRKVHFIHGINRLLYRLENGPLEGGFSLMICLNPGLPPPDASSTSGW